MSTITDNLYTPIRKYETEERMSSEHWYGSVYQTDNKGKGFEFTVSNHIEDGKKYNWRYSGKCRAGFITIFEREQMTVEQMSYYWGKHLNNVQIYKEFENGKGLWVDVITFKGGRFYSIDKAILERLTVSDMHSSFPKMVDFRLWERVNAKNHSHFAYKAN